MVLDTSAAPPESTSTAPLVVRATDCCPNCGKWGAFEPLGDYRGGLAGFSSCGKCSWIRLEQSHKPRTLPLALHDGSPRWLSSVVMPWHEAAAKPHVWGAQRQRPSRADSKAWSTTPIQDPDGMLPPRRRKARGVPATARSSMSDPFREYMLPPPATARPSTTNPHTKTESGVSFADDASSRLRTAPAGALVAGSPLRMAPTSDDASGGSAGTTLAGSDAAASSSPISSSWSACQPMPSNFFCSRGGLLLPEERGGPELAYAPFRKITDIGGGVLPHPPSTPLPFTREWSASTGYRATAGRPTPRPRPPLPTPAPVVSSDDPLVPRAFRSDEAPLLAEESAQLHQRLAKAGVKVSSVGPLGPFRQGAQSVDAALFTPEERRMRSNLRGARDRDMYTPFKVVGNIHIDSIGFVYLPPAPKPESWRTDDASMTGVAPPTTGAMAMAMGKAKAMGKGWGAASLATALAVSWVPPKPKKVYTEEELQRLEEERQARLQEEKAAEEERIKEEGLVNQWQASIPPNIQDAFNTFDRDRSGLMDVSELHAALRLLGVQASEAQARAALRRYDVTSVDRLLDIFEFDHLVRDLSTLQGGSGHSALHTLTPETPLHVPVPRKPGLAPAAALPVAEPAPIPTNKGAPMPAPSRPQTAAHSLEQPTIHNPIHQGASPTTQTNAPEAQAREPQAREPQAQALSDSRREPSTQSDAPPPEVAWLPPLSASERAIDEERNAALASDDLERLRSLRGAFKEDLRVKADLMYDLRTREDHIVEGTNVNEEADDDEATAVDDTDIGPYMVTVLEDRRGRQSTFLRATDGGVAGGSRGRALAEWPKRKR